MRNGIRIPAAVVRLTVGALGAVVVAVLVAEAPALWRYAKIRAM
ncbi:hypothetical protein V1L54_12475 [Streptomyces sp. TRM 70361]|nr:hypothetical protein [Streptomyces sp. TRM 70361]MEE1940206.1 hypothetical protein [Streptomyces sp. TRM 70361]